MSRAECVKGMEKEIKVLQFDGWNWAECYDFAAGRPQFHPSWVVEYETIHIMTSKGYLECRKGDYIVKHTDGQISVSKQKDFEKTLQNRR